jgi:hypothetical protein
MQRARVWIVSMVSLIAVAGGSAAADPLFGVDAGPGYIARPKHAHRQAWYELALVRSQFTATTIGAPGTTLPILADTVRFGIGFKVSSHIYFGGDADFGTISTGSSGGIPVGGRSTVMQPGFDTPSRGTTGGARVFGGVMSNAGSVTGAAELATGARIETTDGSSLMGQQAQQDVLVEGRGRLSLRVSPVVTLGAIAAVDLRDHRDVSIGLAVDFHLYAVGRR